MAKTVKKPINIVCYNCKYSFIEVVTIKAGSEGTEKSTIDVRCPNCGTLLTVEIEGKLRLDSLSLRKFEGKPKKD